MKKTYIVLAALIFNVGCMSTPSPKIIFSLSDSGGCARNNSCGGVSVYDNGTFDGTIGGIHENGRVERAGEFVSYYKITYSGMIEPGLFAEWKQLYDDLDVEALKSELGPGVHAGTFDGVDTMIGIEKDGQSYLLSSIDLKLDTARPFFAKSFAIGREASEQTWSKGTIQAKK